MGKRIKYSHVRREDEPNIEKETIENCPILYRDACKGLHESCMAFGWECGSGWWDALAKLSYQLEALNMQYYPKYRIRIQADQVKEKFGTLRFYYSVVLDGSKLQTWFHNFCYHQFDRICRNVDFKYKKVVDVTRYDYDRKEEITKDEYERELKGIKCSNVEFKIEDGKIFRIVHLTHYEESHNVPTKHRIKYRLMKFWNKLYRMSDSYGRKATTEQEVVLNFMQSEAERLVDAAEDELYETCELCGSTIGVDDEHPRCETAGWIRYICKDCASKHDGQYYTDNGLWEKGKLIKTAVELKKEQNEAVAKRKAKQKKQDKEAEQKIKEVEKELEKKGN